MDWYSLIKDGIYDGLYAPIKWMLHYQPEDAICLFSDPRGGSTWLSEILNKMDDTVALSEPLNINKVKEFRKLPFRWNQYIPEGEQWEIARKSFEHLLSGKIFNHYMTPPWQILTALKAKHPIAGFVYGKALLPWLVNQFQFHHLPILFIRHPMAVVNSQLRHPGWNHDFKFFKIPDNPFNEIYLQHQDFLKQISSKEEELIAIWCINNLVPLSHKDNDKKWITVYYENLLVNPQKELIRIFKRWNKPLPNQLLEGLNKPSSSTTESVNLINQTNILHKWKKHLNPIQQKKMFRVLDYFEVSCYGESVMPLNLFYEE